MMAQFNEYKKTSLFKQIADFGITKLVVIVHDIGSFLFIQKRTNIINVMGKHIFPNNHIYVARYSYDYDKIG